MPLDPDKLKPLQVLLNAVKASSEEVACCSWTPLIMDYNLILVKTGMAQSET